MKELTHTLEVNGMSCPGCAGKVKAYLATEQVPCQIDFASGQLKVAPQDSSRASALVKSLGYTVSEPSLLSHKDKHHSAVELRLVVALVLTLPLLLGHFLGFHALHNQWLQLLLSTPVYMIGLLHFGRSAWVGLRSGVAHMDLLVILGASAAYIYSLVGVAFKLGNNYLFFESAASIITFVMIGGLVEQLAIKKTSSALEQLKSLRPTTVKRVNSSNNKIEEISLEDLRHEDVVALGTGDYVPCDGDIIQGSCEVDESALTGEPIPKIRTVGAKVLAGTTLVSGDLRLVARSIGETTVLGRIIDRVANAQFGRPSIQRLGDTVSAVFVPAVLAIAALTFFINLLLSVPTPEALLRAIAVVVIACPCAMGLATPVAIMVALGELAKRGVLIKSAEIIEGVSEINLAFFDKTGTLTKGEIKVSTIQSELPASELAGVVLGLEHNSSHPIAKAFVREFSSAVPKAFEKIEERPGVGVFGYANDIEYSLQRARTGSKGDVELYIAGRSVASFSLVDQLRSDAAEAVRGLQALGVNSEILSGDSTKRCEEISEALGIPAASHLLPEGKLLRLRAASANRPVIFVGDGVNDVLGLAGAGIGISFSHASDVAVQTAPVVITRPDLRMIPELVAYSRRVLKTIKQNLFWAFFYNIAAIPIAACGLLTPTLAAIVMGLSDIIVVGNSLRLRNRQTLPIRQG